MVLGHAGAPGLGGRVCVRSAYQALAQNPRDQKLRHPPHNLTLSPSTLAYCQAQTAGNVTAASASLRPVTCVERLGCCQQSGLTSVGEYNTSLASRGAVSLTLVSALAKINSYTLS